MEKRHSSSDASVRVVYSKRKLVAVCLLAALFFCMRRVPTLVEVATSQPRCKASGEEDENFKWNELDASPVLKWAPCYGDHECARLQVALDYHDRSVGYAAIALLRVPAKTRGEHYKGPILFNPGGPGGSGTEMVLKWGKKFRDMLGDEYDIIGFDPRGIGHTTPAVNVFDDRLGRAEWDLRYADAPLVNETSTALVRSMARARLRNTMIAEKVASIAQYSNTAVVCRDMLSIVQAHGFDKLQYWGFSYGSILGSSFATLFPDNVGRLVIDGVVDADDYYKGLWSNSLVKTDRGLATVFKQCTESREECALYEESATKVEERYHQLVKTVERNPVVVKTDHTTSIITKRHLHESLFRYLYIPYKGMKPLFEAYRALEQGDGLPLHNMTERLWFPRLSCHCDREKPPPSGGPSGGGESGIAVYCADGLPVENDPDALYEYFEGLAKDSRFGDIWADIRIGCVDYKVKPKWEWHGPVGGNTSFPLLLVGNTEDPVTPWAERMSTRFANSVTLTQESAGHCSLVATSNCTIRAIRDYFREGVLPKKGTVCEIENHMFLSPVDHPIATTTEDAKILGALRDISKSISFAPFPLRLL